VIELRFSSGGLTIDEPIAASTEEKCSATAVIRATTIAAAPAPQPRLASPRLARQRRHLQFAQVNMSGGDFPSRAGLTSGFRGIGAECPLRDGAVRAILFRLRTIARNRHHYLSFVPNNPTWLTTASTRTNAGVPSCNPMEYYFEVGGIVVNGVIAANPIISDSTPRFPRHRSILLSRRYRAAFVPTRAPAPRASKYCAAMN
jgi:hypothetical protein